MQCISCGGLATLLFYMNEWMALDLVEELPHMKLDIVTSPPGLIKPKPVQILGILNSLIYGPNILIMSLTKETTLCH